MSDAPMIFIVGNSRSGTTMLGRVFGLHSQVHTFAELQYFENVISSDEMDRTVSLPVERLVEIGARLLTTIRRTSRIRCRFMRRSWKWRPYLLLAKRSHASKPRVIFLIHLLSWVLFLMHGLSIFTVIRDLYCCPKKTGGVGAFWLKSACP